MKMTIFAISFFFILFVPTYAQSLDYATKESVKVVLPTVNNLITLCSSTEDGFISLIKRYGYYEESSDDVRVISYSNGIDGFLVHAYTAFDYHINRKSVMCWIIQNEMYPQSSINDLYRSLRPYYVGKENSMDKFVFNREGKSYGIIITKFQAGYGIRILFFGRADRRLKEYTN